jgi:hypothetical protein
MRTVLSLPSVVTAKDKGAPLRHRQGSINVDEREGVVPFLHLLGACQRPEAIRKISPAAFRGLLFSRV